MEVFFTRASSGIIWAHLMYERNPFYRIAKL
jgi:hypothetical protein